MRKSHALSETNTIRVNCDTLPRIPESSLIVTGAIEAEHRKQGILVLSKREEKLYVNDEEVIRYRPLKNGERIWGNYLREKLKKKRLLNACVLDALLANSHLIPNEWKNDYPVCFWGTIFWSKIDGGLYVNSLSSLGSNGWYEDPEQLDTYWYAWNYVACLPDLSS